MTQTPQEAARELSSSAIRDGFIPQALHVYTDAAGSPLYWRIRCKHPDSGEKWVRPMRLNGVGYELKEPDFAHGKPLYRLHSLATKPLDRVVVVEGEWCADKLAGLGILATTSGAADSAAKADWAPLTGRDVLIWADNDDLGRRYAAEVGKVLLDLGCRVSVVDLSALGLPPKADAVDWLRLHPGAKAADVLALPAGPFVADAQAEAAPVWDEEEAEVVPWPALSAEALSGIAGDVVNLAVQHSEADQAAVLMTFLAAFGAAAGCGRFLRVGDTEHHSRLFVALVGNSSRARKGTSAAPVKRLMQAAQSQLMAGPTSFPGGLPLKVSDGPLSSGEGLVWAIRDAAETKTKDDEPTDNGVKDKRLLVIEGELGGALRVAGREGSSLSAILRSAWDGGKSNP